MTGETETRAGIWSMGIFVTSSVADIRLWRTPSEVGESDLSSREWLDGGDISAPARGGLEYASTCGRHVVEGSTPRGEMGRVELDRTERTERQSWVGESRAGGLLATLEGVS
jgi:hypothetical protein